MSLLRGVAMQIYIHKLQLLNTKRALKQRLDDEANLVNESSREVFEAWSKFVAQEKHNKRRPSIQKGMGDAVFLPSAAWRVQEDFRRFRKKIAVKYASLLGSSVRQYFSAWRLVVQQGRPRGNPIGMHLMNVESDKLLNEMRVVELLYETRVASAERLLAFFIIFHRAVRPSARAMGVSYPMDRSQSRLRVASTPAPVPFIEDLAVFTETRYESSTTISTCSPRTTCSPKANYTFDSSKDGAEDVVPVFPNAVLETDVTPQGSFQGIVTA